MLDKTFGVIGALLDRSVVVVDDASNHTRFSPKSLRT